MTDAVDRRAHTVYSVVPDEVSTVSQDGPTVIRPHLITLYYPADTPAFFTVKFPKRRVRKTAGQSILIGRGVNADLPLNEEHMPRQFIELWCEVTPEKGPRWFIRNINERKIVRMNSDGVKSSIKFRHERELQTGCELKFDSLTFIVKIEDSDFTYLNEFEMEVLRMGSDDTRYSFFGKAMSLDRGTTRSMSTRSAVSARVQLQGQDSFRERADSNPRHLAWYSPVSDSQQPGEDGHGGSAPSTPRLAPRPSNCCLQHTQGQPCCQHNGQHSQGQVYSQHSSQHTVGQVQPFCQHDPPCCHAGSQVTHGTYPVMRQQSSQDSQVPCNYVHPSPGPQDANQGDVCCHPHHHSPPPPSRPRGLPRQTAVTHDVYSPDAWAPQDPALAGPPLTSQRLHQHPATPCAQQPFLKAAAASETKYALPELLPFSGHSSHMVCPAPLRLWPVLPQAAARPPHHPPLSKAGVQSAQCQCPPLSNPLRRSQSLMAPPGVTTKHAAQERRRSSYDSSAVEAEQQELVYVTQPESALVHAAFDMFMVQPSLCSPGMTSLFTQDTAPKAVASLTHGSPMASPLPRMDSLKLGFPEDVSMSSPSAAEAPPGSYYASDSHTVSLNVAVSEASVFQPPHRSLACDPSRPLTLHSLGQPVPVVVSHAGAVDGSSPVVGTQQFDIRAAHVVKSAGFKDVCGESCSAPLQAQLKSSPILHQHDYSATFPIPSAHTAVTKSPDVMFQAGSVLATKGSDMVYRTGPELATKAPDMAYRTGPELATKGSDMVYRTGTELATKPPHMMSRTGSELATKASDMVAQVGPVWASPSLDSAVDIQWPSAAEEPTAGHGLGRQPQENDERQPQEHGEQP